MAAGPVGPLPASGREEDPRVTELLSRPVETSPARRPAPPLMALAGPRRGSDGVRAARRDLVALMLQAAISTPSHPVPELPQTTRHPARTTNPTLLIRLDHHARPVISLLSGGTHRLHQSRRVAGSAALDATTFINALMAAEANALVRRRLRPD